MVEFLIIATILRHPREPLYGDYSKIFLPCEINNLLYWRKMFSLFILKTKTFHICLICCCHSQDNHLSTFKKTRALQTSQTKLLFLVAAIWSRLSCSSLRRIDPSWGGWKAAGDALLQTAALKCLSGTFLPLRRRDKSSIKARVWNSNRTDGWRLTGSRATEWRSVSPMRGRQREMATGGKLNLTRVEWGGVVSV